MNTRNSLCQRPTSGAARITTVLFGLFSLATAPASAQWTITPYVWATDLGVDVSVHDQTVVDQTIGFTDLVKDLDMAAQLRVEGQCGHLGVMADLFDVRLSTSSGQIAMPDGAVATLDSRIRMTLLDVGGMFDPDGSPTGFAFFYGARILVQSAEVDASLQVDPSMAVPASSDESDTLVDALVGWRYTRTVGSGWALETQGDVTTGGTKLTWSVGGRIARSFGSRYTVSAGYRQMSIQFKDEPPVQVGMEMSGLMIGVGIGL